MFLLCRYLYYTIKQQDGKGGLYVVDIADFDQPGEPSARQLIDAHIQTFTIDHEHLLLYYPSTSHNTVMSAYLDGSGITDTRHGKVARPHFQGVRSLVHYDRKFYWTNSSLVFGEEFDLQNRMYYHFSLPLLETHFIGFNLYYPGSQPVPGKHLNPDLIPCLCSVALSTDCGVRGPLTCVGLGGGHVVTYLW